MKVKTDAFLYYLVSSGFPLDFDIEEEQEKFNELWEKYETWLQERLNEKEGDK